MANLKDLLVNGASRFVGDIFANKAQLTSLQAPTTSGGSTYGLGTSGQVLKTNGTSLYWGADNNSGGTVTSVRVQATSPVVSSQNTAQTGTLNTTISLADGYGDTKNPYASKTANYVLAAPNGSNGVPTFRPLAIADIPGLSSAMHFIGTTTTEMSDGLETASISIGGNSYSPSSGDVVLYGDSEYVWTGSAWERLGRDSSFKIVQTAVTKPAEITNKWVSAIGQDTEGVISVDYQDLDTSGTWTGKLDKTFQVALNNTQYSYDGSANINLSTIYAPTTGGTTSSLLKSTGNTSTPDWTTSILVSESSGTIGTAQITIGNAIPSGSEPANAGNARGQLVLYGTNDKYHVVRSAADGAQNYNHCLPNKAGWLASGGSVTFNNDGSITGTGVGDATHPVYLEYTGVLTALTNPISPIITPIRATMSGTNSEWTLTSWNFLGDTSNQNVNTNYYMPMIRNNGNMFLTDVYRYVGRLYSTTSDIGYAGIVLGNNISTGTAGAGNAYGFIRLYSVDSSYHTINGSTAVTTAVNHSLPGASGWLATGGNGSSTGVGGADQIVYLNTSGILTAGTSATNANTASTIVKRDASGNFSAGTITATLSGNASSATKANITTTANAVAYYTNTTGTFGSKASANGALYATAANGALQWGTLPVAQGGTGATSFTADSVVISGSTTTSALTTRAITNNTSNTAAINNNTNIPTMNTLFYTLAQINNANQTHATSVYAPTVGGTAGRILKAAGATSAPTWSVATTISESLGTTETIGAAGIILGNSTASGTVNNTQGFLRLYSTGTKYHQIQTSPTTSTSNFTHYLPNRTGWIAMGGTATAGQEVGVGSAIQPVYLNAAGILTACNGAATVQTQVLVRTGTDTTSYSMTFNFAPDVIIAMNGYLSDCPNIIYDASGVHWDYDFIFNSNIVFMRNVTTDYQSVVCIMHSDTDNNVLNQISQVYKIGLCFNYYPYVNNFFNPDQNSGGITHKKSADGKTYYLRALSNSYGTANEESIYNRIDVTYAFLAIKFT